MIELTYKSGIMIFASLHEALDHISDSYPDSREWPSIIKKDGEVISKGNQVPAFVIMRYMNKQNEK